MKPLPRILTRRLATAPLPALTLRSPSPLLRPLHPPAAAPAPDDFVLYPSFLSEDEQDVLVRMALSKLGRSRAGAARRARRQRAGAGVAADGSGNGLQRLFTGEYAFEEGHYDSVIHGYRESLLSTLPPSPHPLLAPTLRRIYSLFFSSLPALPHSTTHTETPLPPAGTLTHILHLSPTGAILPHVDNLEASGRVILGVSLGAERTLRLRRKLRDGAGVEKGESTGEKGWEVRLGSGSVYIQRDAIRYGYEHSILPFDDPSSIWDGERLEPGHRISIMIRDVPPKPDL